MNNSCALLLTLTIFINAGCAKVTRTYLAEDVFTQPIGDEKPYFTKRTEQIDLSKVKLSDYEGDDNKAKREVLISDMIALSDKKCSWYKATVMANANIWNISAGTAAILFAGASSVISHANTAADLAAAAAATSGIRSLANQEIYSDALVTTILRAIDVKREKKLAVISAGLLADNYSVAAAVRDVQTYHDACSLVAGLVEVTSALDNRKKSRAEVQRDIKSLESAIKRARARFGGTATASETEQLTKLQERLTQRELQLTEAAE